MNRRSFLWLSGLSGAAVAGGLAVHLVLRPARRARRLERDLRPLADDFFEAAAWELEAPAALARLEDAKIVGPDGALDLAAVARAARTDEIVPYRGFQYTETELALHALAYRVHRRGESLPR